MLSLSRVQANYIPTSMNPFSLALPLGLIGPALTVGVFAYFWRAALPRFWWFVGIGAITSYVLMAACLNWALSGVGITGSAPTAPAPLLDPFMIDYLSYMLLWLAGSAVILFLIRDVLSKI
jgi:hypothetical protein